MPGLGGVLKQRRSVHLNMADACREIPKNCNVVRLQKRLDGVRLVADGRANQVSQRRRGSKRSRETQLVQIQRSSAQISRRGQVIVEKLFS